MAELEQPRAWARIVDQGDPLRVELGGQLDIASLPAIEPDVDALMRHDPANVVIDMHEVEFIDSSAVALLIRLANHFGNVTLERVNPMVQRIVEVLGLTGHLSIGQGSA
jgi:anti-anti-sigma factor